MSFVTTGSESTLLSYSQIRQKPGVYECVVNSEGKPESFANWRLLVVKNTTPTRPNTVMVISKDENICEVFDRPRSLYQSYTWRGSKRRYKRVTGSLTLNV